MNISNLTNFSPIHKSSGLNIIKRKYLFSFILLLLFFIAFILTVKHLYNGDSNVTQTQDVDAAVAVDKSLDIISLGIEDASTPVDPLNSYYDDLSNRTYLVYSGGAKTDYPAGSCSDTDELGPKTDIVCFPKSYATSAMHVFIKYYDHTTKTWSASKKVFEPGHTELYGDGHYAQGVIVDNNGYIHVFQSYHISLRPKCSTQEVGIRHATSLTAGSIDKWTTAKDIENNSGSINTDRNSHGVYFKSRAGDIYGIFRKSYSDEGLQCPPPTDERNTEKQVMFKFKPATVPNNANNGITENSLTVKNVVVPDKKVTNNLEVLSWNKNLGRTERIVLTGDSSKPNPGVGWDDAYLTTSKQDLERDGVHLVFMLRAGRTYVQKYYYVFFSFVDDKFYSPGGEDLGSDIIPSKFDKLNGCCVIHDYGIPRDSNALTGRPVAMLNYDHRYPTFYLDSVDVEANETVKTIWEINFNPTRNKWESKKLRDLGFTHRVDDAVFVNPDNKYLTTISVAGNTPGMAETRLYQWDGSSWKKRSDMKSSLFYAKQQTRGFRFANNFRRDLSGFFANLHDSVFTPPISLSTPGHYEGIPDWTIWGYYEGPIKSKLFGFRLNELLQSPVYNGNFEKNNFEGWPWKDDLDTTNTSIVDCKNDGLSCPQGKYYLKLVGKNDNKGDYTPYLVSNDIDMRENLTEKSIKITFRAKVHTGSAQYSGIFLQRSPNRASTEPWKDTSSAIQPVLLTTEWKTVSQIVQLPKSGNNSTTTAVRIVLSPIDEPFSNPVYLDDFQLEYLGKITPPPLGQGSVPNGSFENATGSFAAEGFPYWGFNPTMDSNGSRVDVCSQESPCPDGRNFAVVARQIGKNDAHFSTDWIETGQNLSGKTVQVKFDVKAHNDKSNPKLKGLFIQREHTANSGWLQQIPIPESSVSGVWQTKTFNLTFPVSSDINTQRFRIVLRPEMDLPYQLAYYYDNISFTMVAPTDNPKPNCPVVEIASIAGVCNNTGYKASVTWNAVEGATEYAIGYDDDTQFWSDSPEIGEPVGAAFTTQTSKEIDFNIDKTRYFKVRVAKSNTCTPQNWLYGNTKTITSPVCVAYQSPTASFSQFPSEVTIERGNSTTLQGVCNDADGNLTECYLVKRERPPGGNFGEWSSAKQKVTKTIGTNNLTTSPETWTCDSGQDGMAHEWIVKGIDKNGNKCTGEENPPIGWTSCGAHDRVVFTCVPPHTPTSSYSELPRSRKIVVRARGTQVDNIWPRLEVHIKDDSGTYLLARTFTIKNIEYKDYVYWHPTPVNASQIRLSFVNDARNPQAGTDRNVYIDYIRVGRKYQTEAPTTYSTGTWMSTTGKCSPGFNLSEALHCNGSFTFFKE